MYFYVLVILIISAEVFIIIPNMDLNEKPCGIEANSKNKNPIHQNPWTVFLEYYKDDKRNYLRCAGSLISSRHVITAAHCVKGIDFTSLKARLGEYDLFTDQDCVDDICSDAPVRLKVARIHVPKTYDADRREDDIAVLELDKDAPYTDFIRPICLPTSKNLEGTKLTASGWGERAELNTHTYSHVKKVIPLPSWSDEECRKAYKHPLPDKIICAGGEIGIDTCRGDSGGPLVLNTGKLDGNLKNDGKFSGNFKSRIELIGVTSAGPKHCGAEGFPGIYTSVYDHLDFIKRVIGHKENSNNSPLIILH